MQQQPEDNLIYWAPSRVRFNLTLILAGVVIVLGVLQYVGIDPISAVCSPPRSEPTATTPSDGVTTPAPGAEGETPGQNEGGRRGNSQAWLLILVGVGVGAYSWLTSPRQYRIYGSALVILYGMPRRRTIHFSAIREVANDHGRGAMGDPLRIYTANRRRVAIQVREPDEMYPYLQKALDDFRRAHPEYAPPPEPEPASESEPTAGPASASEREPAAPDTVEEAPRREGRPRRRSLRGDDDGGGAGSGDRGRDAGSNAGSGRDGGGRTRRRRSLRGDDGVGNGGGHTGDGSDGGGGGGNGGGA